MKRPILVWLICAYLSFAHLGALGSLVAVFLLPTDETQWASNWYRSQPWWVLVYLILNVCVWIAAAVSLFQMRKLAFTLFSIATIFGFGNLVWQSLSPWLAASPVASIDGPVVSIGLVVGCAILVAMMGYVYYLRTKGLLRERAA